MVRSSLKCGRTPGSTYSACRDAAGEGNAEPSTTRTTEYNIYYSLLLLELLTFENRYNSILSVIFDPLQNGSELYLKKKYYQAPSPALLITQRAARVVCRESAEIYLLNVRPWLIKVEHNI